jgi:hypothetical protein
MQSVVISFHVPQKLKERVVKRANEKGVSLSRYASDILTAYFKDKPKEEEDAREQNDGNCPVLTREELL